MSRTYKDAPYYVRACRQEGRPCPSDWRERWSWRHSHPRFNGYDTYDDYYAAREAWDADQPRSTTWRDPIIGEYARQENRVYRNRTNQLVREGRYDEIERPRRNARWLAR